MIPSRSGCSHLPSHLRPLLHVREQMMCEEQDVRVSYKYFVVVCAAVCEDLALVTYTASE